MLTPPEIAQRFLAVGENKAKLPAGRMFLLAVLAGVYISRWQALARQPPL